MKCKIKRQFKINELVLGCNTCVYGDMCWKIELQKPLSALGKSYTIFECDSHKEKGE